MRSLLHAFVLVLLPVMFFGCFKTRDEIAREQEQQEVQDSLQKNVVEYSQDLDKVQADIGKLQGRVDEIEHQRKKEMSGYADSQ